MVKSITKNFTTWWRKYQRKIESSILLTLNNKYHCDWNWISVEFICFKLHKYFTTLALWRWFWSRLVLLWWGDFPAKIRPSDRYAEQNHPPEEGNDDVDGGSTRDQGGHPHHQAGVVSVAHWNGHLAKKYLYYWCGIYKSMASWKIPQHLPRWSCRECSATHTWYDLYEEKPLRRQRKSRYVIVGIMVCCN